MAYDHGRRELRQRLLHDAAELTLALNRGDRGAVHGVVCHEILIAAFPAFAIGEFADAVPDGVAAGGIEATGVVAHSRSRGQAKGWLTPMEQLLFSHGRYSKKKASSFLKSYSLPACRLDMVLPKLVLIESKGVTANSLSPIIFSFHLE